MSSTTAHAPSPRALVAGWFSFEHMGATAGDLMTRDTVCRNLREIGIAFDVAVAPPFTDGCDWRTLDPSLFTHFIFVCGPIGNGPPVDEMLARFQHCRRVGLNLSMLHRVQEWNPFDLLLERDSDAAVRPDLVFASPPPRVPVAGLLLVHPQKEYGKRGRHDAVHAAIHDLIARHELAVVPIDTRLDRNTTGLRTAGEIESLIARMDLVLTTRLHGTVLALKNGVPALAVDPIAGGAKISMQCRALEWPICLGSDQIAPGQLDAALAFCLSPEGRAAAARSAAIGRAATDQIQSQLRDFFAANAVQA